MIRKLILCAMLASTTLLAGCLTGNDGDGTSAGVNDDDDSGSSDDGTPDTSVYTPTYASDSMPTLKSAFATSRRIDSNSGVNESREDNGLPGSDGRSYLAENERLSLRKTDSGFIMSYRGQDVNLNRESNVNGNYIRNETDDGEQVNLGYIASPNGSVNDLNNDNVMVPVRFGVLSSDNGSATAANNDSYIEGYSVVGVETDPTDMPRNGSATYIGEGVLEAAPRNDQDPHALFAGRSRFDADFGEGTISGRLDIEERSLRDPNDGVLSSEFATVRYGDDPSRPAGRVIVPETDLNANQFQTGLQFSDRARAIMGEAGVSSDTSATATGRFYGEDAEGVGAIVRGEGSSHVVTGVISGAR